jgi:hypothetical protein
MGSCYPMNDPTGFEADVMLNDMRVAGWSGDNYVQYDAWPQDFRESCNGIYGPGGLDNQYGDAFDFTVFTGHSGPGEIFYSHPHDNGCKY